MSTTVLPRSEARVSSPLLSSRSSVKAGATGDPPRASSDVTSLSPCASFQTEQAEQRDDDGDGHDLRAETQPADSSARCRPGVPMSTWVKSHSTSGIRMRMHPCETE